MYLYYIPLLPLYGYFALRSRNLSYFTGANPAIKDGGNATESKFKTLGLIPTKYTPKSILIANYTNFKTIENELKKATLNYPLIAKPDIGYRGLLVKKINNKKELLNYLTRYQEVKIIIQEFVDFPNECGILYYRYPTKKKGTITSITLKKYLTVIGDGISSIKQLLNNDERNNRYLSVVKSANKLIKIPSKNKTVILSEIGNHCKGSQFINGNHLIDKDLHNFFDVLSQSIKGVYFGRFDIKFNSFEELKKGENFKIIELNGVISEPTHIYDNSKGSYFKALKSIAKHWYIVYKISKINFKNKHLSFPKSISVIKDLMKLRPYNKKIQQLSER